VRYLGAVQKMQKSVALSALLKKLAQESPSIHLEIPLRLQPKARPRMVERGRKRWWFTPSGKNEEEVGLYAAKVMREMGWRPFSGKVKLSCTIYLKGRRRADLDNYIKAATDALEGICYYNDIQIAEYGSVKIIDRAKQDLILIDLEEVGKFERKTANN